MRRDGVTRVRGITGRVVAGIATALLAAALFLFPMGGERASALRETYVFDGSGWGHGVGMCQYGARGMAAAGFNYQQILTYYFQGTQVTDWTCPSSIRVGLLEGMREIELKADSGDFVFFLAPGGDIPGGTITRGTTWRVRPSADGRFLIYRPDGSLLNGTSYGGPAQPVYVRGTVEGNVLRLPQNGNRGLSHLTAVTPLELNVYGSPYTLRAVLISWFETYLKGVAEVPGSWPQEAVRAQAVAARSYAVRFMNKHASSNFNLCDEVHCQYYQGYDKEKDTGWVQAVDATRGKVLTYQGQVAQCFYSSSCGGHTDNNEDVWGGSPVPYLRGVPDPYCMDSVNPYAHWTVTMSRQEIESRLNASSSTKVGTLYSVDLSSRTPSGRVRWAVFNGSAGKVTVSGEQLRSLLGLRSAMVHLRSESFEEYILLANPSGSAASARVRMTGGGKTAEADVELPPFTRRTVRVNDHLDGSEVAVQVEADRDIVVERAMYFNYLGNLDGGSCSPGIPALSNNWYLAEGYTALSFDTWVLLYNPGEQAAHADVRLMREDGYVRELDLEVPASSRVTLSVDAQEGFSACAFSTQVHSSQPLAVERAVYFDSEGRKGGHTAEGSPELSTRWYFAEGYTGGSFDAWILVGNPGDQPATVKFHLLTQSGGKALAVERTVGAGSRLTLHVDDYLPGAEVAVSLESDRPVVAERAMYFDYFGREGGSCAMGSRETAGRWFLAEGYTGGAFDEYVLVGNPLEEAARVRISLFTQGGLQREVYADLAPRSRYTLHVDELIPSEDVSAQVEEVNGKGVVVERAMYFDYGGKKGGHASQGITGTSMRWYFAEGYTGS
ncbi:MAG: DUF5719 family protein [Actinomycetota bacterium]